MLLFAVVSVGRLRTIGAARAKTTGTRAVAAWISSFPPRTARGVFLSTIGRQRRRCSDDFGTFTFATADEENIELEDLSALLPLYLPGDEKVRRRPIRTVAAPMVASSDYAFRCLCRQYGTDLTFTQMLHARNLVSDSKFRDNHLDLYECLPAGTEPPPWSIAQENCMEVEDPWREVGGSGSVFSSCVAAEAESGPLIVQLAGNDADTILRASDQILETASAMRGRGVGVGVSGSGFAPVAGIDLNLGCPQGIARKGNYGAFFMDRDNGQEACRILSALRLHLPETVAVSAKIRLPPLPDNDDDHDDPLLRDRIARLVDSGISFLTVHGRTLRENKTKAGPCNDRRLAAAVTEAHRHAPGFPVIVNGGVEFQSDVSRLMRETGAAAVMSSEALLETPDLFAAVSSSDVHPVSVADQDRHHHCSSPPPRRRLIRQLQLAREYLDWCHLYPPLPGAHGRDCGSFSVVRGHLFKMLYRYLQEHTDLRDSLASYRTTTVPQALDLIRRLESRYANLTDDELKQSDSSKPSSSWYRRHRDDYSNQAHQKPQTGSGMQAAAAAATSSIQERKLLMKQRIARLKAQRLERQRQERQPQQQQQTVTEKHLAATGQSHR